MLLSMFPAPTKINLSSCGPVLYFVSPFCSACQFRQEPRALAVLLASASMAFRSDARKANCPTLVAAAFVLPAFKGSGRLQDTWRSSELELVMITDRMLVKAVRSLRRLVMTEQPVQKLLRGNFQRRSPSSANLPRITAAWFDVERHYRSCILENRL
jgi:hypothetical protein